MAIGASEIEGGYIIVRQIDSSPADVETEDTFEENLNYYESNKFTYIPMPRDGVYFDRNNDNTETISQNQLVREDLDVFAAMELLLEYPFLLVDYSPRYNYIIDDGVIIGRTVGEEDDERWIDFVNDWVDTDHNLIDDIANPPDVEPQKIESNKKYSTLEMEQNYPKLLDKMTISNYDERYGMITLADLNKRQIKERLYPVFAELANVLSNKIEKHHIDPNEIMSPLRPATIGYWYQSKADDLELHIAEYMSLVEMKEVIKMSEDGFVEECGFESKNQLEREVGGIEKSRNKVMHANRTLIHNRDDLETLIDRIYRAQDIVDRID